MYKYMKGKTYKVKVVVSAAGNDKYKPGKATAVFKIKISLGQTMD